MSSTAQGSTPYYFVPHASRHPVMAAIGLFFVILGAGQWVNGHQWGAWSLLFGLLWWAFVLFQWFGEAIRESEGGLYGDRIDVSFRWSMSWFIFSEVMFFAAFFWAYFDAALFYGEARQVERVAATGGVWPPEGVITFDPFDLPFLNTLILLLSGCTVTWAHHALLHGDRKGLIQGLTYTVLLGILFTSLQAYEYSHAAFGFREGIYPSTFFMATGFHGFHVIVGTIFLIVCWFRAWRGHFKPDHHFGFEAAAWYWHFVDVVWLFLFVSIYIGGAGEVAAGH